MQQSLCVMNLELQKEGKFEYFESGTEGETIVLLHGLFGALSNFGVLIDAFKDKYNVVVPILPIYTLPKLEVGVKGLVKHVTKFIEHKGFGKVHLLGNSLGGHVGILYALAHPEHVASITLTGSSGLFESAFGTAFPQRGNYEYIKNKTAETFFDPEMASKELVDEVFDIVNDRMKALHVVMTAKSAVRHNLKDKIHALDAPALLIWGNQDTVTPPFVGEQFNELLPNSRLHLVDKCGHAPMMERPEVFNPLFERFLQDVILGNFKGEKGAVEYEL